MSPPAFWTSALRALRPRQWTKNVFVLAPLVFAKSARDPHWVVNALLGFVAFSFVASAVYVFNDWLDREKDRLHPEKKHRPIAAGHLGPLGAFLLALLCLSLGTGASLLIERVQFFYVIGAYLLLQLAYTTVLKHQVIVDVMAIASGFVLRVVAGAEAIHVPVSNWLYLCTLLLAIFLGFAKRRHELSLLEGEAKSHRANLEEYSLPMIDQFMSIVAAACIVAYGLYTVSIGNEHMKFTLPFVLYGLFRYLFLVHRKGEGGAPEKIVLSDKGLLVNAGLFLVVACWALYV